jgi:NAD(P)-dependent dehydrogenase (short-subunit alcohol dehydrogenase family)
MRHAGKVVVITGAGNGMGEACAQRFAKEGAAGLVLNDLDGDALDRVAADLAATGTRVEAIPGSAAERAVADAMVAAADNAFGRIDVLVCCAGGGGRGEPLQPMIGERPNDFLNVGEETWRNGYTANLMTAVVPGQAIARYMVTRGLRGAIVNIASVQSVLGVADSGAYGPTKAAVANLTRGMAMSLAPHGIRVNAIGPGPTATRMLLGPIKDNPAFSREMLSRTPLGRWAEPDEMAAPIAFLASEEASYITGQVIYVDGGRLALNFVVPVADGPARIGREA